VTISFPNNILHHEVSGRIIHTVLGMKLDETTRTM